MAAKDEIKTKLGLVDFLQGRGLDMRPSGATRYVALCPFHDEKTPSFSVSITRNTWHCYGCGKSGDVFSYLEEKEGLSFPDAVASLAESMGISISQSDESMEDGRHRHALIAIVGATWDWFQSNYDALPENHEAKANEIRRKRGISDRNEDNHGLFGWAPENGGALQHHLESIGYDVDDMIAAGVLVRGRDGSAYCPWRRRLMFPIRDVLGRPMGFSGREVYYDPDSKIQRKYVNSAANELYDKSRLLFCQDIAREQAHRDREVFVVEGQFDVIAMQHAGHDNVVASSGTALTQWQIGSLRRMVGVDGRIVFMFDADDAGQKAAIRTFTILGVAQSQAWASITDGKDPSDMLHDDGPDALRAQCDRRVELWRHVLRRLASIHDLSTPEGRSAFLTAIRPIYESMTSPAMADAASRLIALWTGESLDSILSTLGKPGVTGPDPERTIDPIPVDSPDAAQETLMATIMDNPSLAWVASKVPWTGACAAIAAILPDVGPRGITPGSFTDPDVSAAVTRIDAIIDGMDQWRLAGPMAVDPADLLIQQLESFALSRERMSIGDVIRSHVSDGTSTDVDVSREYDSVIRSGVTDARARWGDGPSGFSSVIAGIRDDIREHVDSSGIVAEIPMDADYLDLTDPDSVITGEESPSPTTPVAPEDDSPFPAYQFDAAGHVDDDAPHYEGPLDTDAWDPEILEAIPGGI